MPPNTIETIGIAEILTMLEKLQRHIFDHSGGEPRLMKSDNGNFILSEDIQSLIEKLRTRIINDQNEDDWK